MSDGSRTPSRGGRSAIGGPVFWTDGPVPPALAAELTFGRDELVRRLGRRWGQRAPARTLLVGHQLSGRRTALRASLREAEQQGVGLHAVVLPCASILPATGRGLAEGFLAATRGRVSVSVWNQVSKELRHPDEREAEGVLGQLDRILGAFPRGGRAIVVFESAEALDGLPEGALRGLEAWAAGSNAHIVATVSHVPVRLRELVPTVFGTAGVRETRLEGVSRSASSEFLARRLAAARCQASADAVGLVLEFADGQPAALQWIGRAVVDQAKRAGRGLIGLDDAVEAIAEASAALPTAWVEPLGSLSGRLRDVFVALSLSDASTVSEVGERIHLDAKNVSVLAGRLIDRGYPVEKVDRGRYRIAHRLLREHVRRRFASS